MTKTWKKKLMIGSLALASVMVLSAPKAEAYGVIAGGGKVAGFTGVGAIHPSIVDHDSVSQNHGEAYKLNFNHRAAGTKMGVCGYGTC